MVSEPEGRGLLSNPRCGWEDNIKMDLKKRLEGVTGLVWQNRDKWVAVVSLMNPWYCKRQEISRSVEVVEILKPAESLNKIEF